MVVAWLLAGTAVKFLCFNLYYSTDLAVHQYWIALTGEKHWSEWYTDEASEWSLDYPPAFAVFQLLLYWLLSGTSKVISLLPKASRIQETGQAIDLAIQFPPQNLAASPMSIYALRTTVVLSDIVLIFGLYQYGVTRHTKKTKLTKFCRYLSFRLPLIKRTEYCWKKDPFLITFILTYFNVGLLMVDRAH